MLFFYEMILLIVIILSKIVYPIIFQVNEYIRNKSIPLSENARAPCMSDYNRDNFFTFSLSLYKYSRVCVNMTM